MEEPDRGLNANSQALSNSYASMGRFFQRGSAFDCMHPAQTGGMGLAPHGPPGGFGYSAYPGDWGFMHSAASYAPGFNFNRTINNPATNFFPVSRDFGAAVPPPTSGPPPLIGATPTSGGLPCESDNYGSGLCSGSSCPPSPTDQCLSDDLDKKENKNRGKIEGSFTAMSYPSGCVCSRPFFWGGVVKVLQYRTTIQKLLIGKSTEYMRFPDNKIPD